MSHQDVIFVLGSGRSGTSALTRVLSLCGCGLPPSVLGPVESNPKGLWESPEFLRINTEFMERTGTTFGGAELFLEGEAPLPVLERQEYVGEIQRFLGECPCGPPLLIKWGGMMADLMEYWLEGAGRLGYRVKVVLAIRHPQEVVSSTNAVVSTTFPGPMSVEAGSALWLKNNLLAERYSRDLPRVVVNSENLLKDWRAQVVRVSQVLHINLQANEAVDTFLTPTLYRQKRTGPIAEPFGYPWMSEVYGILSNAAQDKPIDSAAMDAILDAYRANPQSLAPATEEMWTRRRQGEGAAFLRELRVWPTWRLGTDY